MDGFANNKEISSTTKLGEHIPCGYSMSISWAFDNIENKDSLYRREDCMEKLCSSLREYAINVTNFEKNKMLLLTKKELKLPKGKNKKVIGVTKDELGGKIMKKFVGLKAKTYSYLIDDGSEDKKAKGTNKCVIKGKHRLEDYENCLEAAQLENKINDLGKITFMW